MGRPLTKSWVRPCVCVVSILSGMILLFYGGSNVHIALLLFNKYLYVEIVKEGGSGFLRCLCQHHEVFAPQLNSISPSESRIRVSWARTLRPKTKSQTCAELSVSRSGEYVGRPTRRGSACLYRKGFLFLAFYLPCACTNVTKDTVSFCTHACRGFPCEVPKPHTMFDFAFFFLTPRHTLEVQRVLVPQDLRRIRSIKWTGGPCMGRNVLFELRSDARTLPENNKSSFLLRNTPPVSLFTSRSHLYTVAPPLDFAPRPTETHPHYIDLWRCCIDSRAIFHPSNSRGGGQVSSNRCVQLAVKSHVLERRVLISVTETPDPVADAWSTQEER